MQGAVGGLNAGDSGWTEYRGQGWTEIRGL
jgi:hypothetical protein